MSSCALFGKIIYIKSEASNLLKGMDNMGIDDQLSRDPNKENKEDILHFDNINFKLAIIQVLMYDLKLLEPRFDIYDFIDLFLYIKVIIKGSPIRGKNISPPISPNSL